MHRGGGRAVRHLCTTPHVKNPAPVLKVAVQDGRALEVSWDGRRGAVLDATWLRLACGSCLHETSQRLMNANDLQVFPSRIVSAALSHSAGTGAAPEATVCHVTFTDGHEAKVPAAVLERYAWGEPELTDPLHHDAPLTTADWTRLTSKGGGDVARLELWTVLKGIAEQGLAVVNGMPDNEEALTALAELIAPVMPTLYGNTFEVRAEPNPINIAYTTHSLALHMDLAYYESPPGIQLLNCREFTEEVTAGESTFLDAHEAAEELRRRHPASFATLTRVAARFQKDHLARENPAQMFFDRPHIITHPRTGEVTQVFWAPPFEGLLHAPPEEMEKYYTAYRHFAAIIEDPASMAAFGRCFRLQKGQTVLFNNRRLLHGRRAFELNGGVRHLQGCYLEIDDYQNTFLNVARDYADAHTAFPRIGNGDLCVRPGAGVPHESVESDADGRAAVARPHSRTHALSSI